MSRGMATIVTTVSVEFWKCKVSSRISIDGFTVDALLERGERRLRKSTSE